MKAIGKQKGKENATMSGWVTQELGSLATVSAGNSAPQDKSLFQDGQHPFVRTADVGRVRFGIIKSTSDYLNDAGVAKLRRFPRGTILFPKSGASTYLNHRVMMGFDGYVASHLATIQAKEEKLHPKFLLYFLHTVDARDLVQDQSYPSLNLPLIESIPVPLPPLPEQKRIVAVLDKAFAAIETSIANTERNIANVQELFESELHRVFYAPKSVEKSDGSEMKGKVCKVGDVCRIAKKKHNGDLLPYLGLEHIESGTGRLACEPVPAKVKSSTFYFDETHLLYGRLRPYLNKVFLPDFNGHCTTEIFPIQCGPKLHRRFLFYWLIDKTTVDAINRTSTGARMPRANINALLDFKFRIPSIHEQKRIAAILDKLSTKKRSLINIHKTKIERLSEFKRAILRQAFAGELAAKI